MQDTATLSLKPLGLQDAVLVDHLLDQLADYSMRVDGVAKLADGACRLLVSLPPGRPPHSKHVFAVMQGHRAIGLVDVIAGYPQSDTAFIGLLAIAPASRSRGLGRAAYERVERFARLRLAARTIRLAVVGANPVIGFWEKLGFEPTGETRAYAGAARTDMAMFMQKRLPEPPAGST